MYNIIHLIGEHLTEIKKKEFFLKYTAVALTLVWHSLAESSSPASYRILEI